jgi:DNA polymerase-1
MGKLLAIDGMAIIRRVYEANPDPDSPEKIENALQNALASFRKILATHAPTHAFVAFGGDAPGWRSHRFPSYGQHRSSLPRGLTDRLVEFLVRLRALDLAPLLIPDAEANDMIATAATRWLAEERGEVIVVAYDKSLYALLPKGVRIWDYFKKEWRDAGWVEEKFGVTPGMLPDLFALVGDSTAGIPGVPKIGMKTAARLLRSYQTLEGVMAGAGILKDALGEKLRKDKDQAYLSRELIGLRTDLHLGITWNMIRLED